MNARRQEAAPVIEWSVDAADGPLQGPLALAFLHGRTLSLALGAGQAALLLGEGRLQAVLPYGRHVFPVGSRPGDVDARWHLLFLSTTGALASRWTPEAPLRCGHDLALVGTGRLDITDPAAFHGAFLAGVTTVDPAFVLVLVDRLLQAAIAARATAGPATVLQPSDLAVDLAPCGLACRELAIAVATAAPGPAIAVGTPLTAPSGQSGPLRRH